MIVAANPNKFEKLKRMKGKNKGSNQKARSIFIENKKEERAETARFKSKLKK